MKNKDEKERGSLGVALLGRLSFMRIPILVDKNSLLKVNRQLLPFNNCVYSIIIILITLLRVCPKTATRLRQDKFEGQLFKVLPIGIPLRKDRRAPATH